MFIPSRHAICEIFIFLDVLLDDHTTLKRCCFAGPVPLPPFDISTGSTIFYHYSENHSSQGPRMRYKIGLQLEKITHSPSIFLFHWSYLSSLDLVSFIESTH